MLAKTELGEEAVVLNTKHVKVGGVLGLGGGTKVELMAAIDDSQPVAVAAPAATAVPAAFPRVDVPAPAPAVAVAAPVYEPAQAPAPFAAKLYASAAAPAVQPEPEMSQLRSEVKELSAIVQQLIGAVPVQTPAQPASLQKPLLVRAGVDEDLARSMFPELLAIDEPMALASRLAAKMQAFALPPVLDSRQVIALVGPTGVGKTTTLAKLAAKFALEQGKKVALVTADTYRIGAVEQLRIYARIMGIPLEVALSPEEVTAGVEKHADKDVVLVDTVGRSQKNDEHLAELKSFVDAANPTETHLVVAASLSSEIQREVVEKFKVLSPTRLAITKLDESSNRGSLVNLPLITGLGISCLTAGQNVPQDIDLAEVGKIARMIVGVA